MAARRGVAVAAVSANAGDLNYGLIHVGVICLDRMNVGAIARDCDVDRVVQYEASMDEPPVERAVAAIAGLASARLNVPAAPSVA